jgi:hypothetical protein
MVCNGGIARRAAVPAHAAVKQSERFLYSNPTLRSALIRYEFPFNESIRTMLRLEHLFDRLGQLVVRDAALDHHHALGTLFEIMDVAARADLKSDLLKDLERQRLRLNGYRDNPSVSQPVLEEVAGRVDAAFSALNQMSGKAGAALTANEWLMSIRSRISIPGGTCGFDLPAYYAWQQFDAAARFGLAARGPGRRGPLPAESADRPHLPAAAAEAEGRARSGARNQRPPLDAVGATDAAGQRRAPEAQRCRHTLRVELVPVNTPGRPKCECSRSAGTAWAAKRLLRGPRRRAHP